MANLVGCFYDACPRSVLEKFEAFGGGEALAFKRFLQNGIHHERKIEMLMLPMRKCRLFCSDAAIFVVRTMDAFYVDKSVVNFSTLQTPYFMGNV